jgi:predicted ATPase/class 3 adenylate cyclase
MSTDVTDRFEAQSRIRQIMVEAPTGTVTFLFTDIEGSTRLLQELGDRYEAIEVQHAAILRQAIAEGGGTEIRTEGDSFFAAFPHPAGAIRAAVTAQRALAGQRWPDDVALRVRMGMHTGEGRTGGSGAGADYIGIDVNRAARIAAAGHGGQVLISDATRGLVEHALPDGVTIRDLGKHRLKDIEHPERIHDLVIDGLPADFPPIRTLASPSNLPPERTSFVGREREMEQVNRLLSEARLLTLTGPGGTGKTRLGLKVAAEQRDRFADGVFLVDLSVIVEPGLVPSAIASALRVREEPGRDLLDTLADHLRDREVLLLIDNFEQVAEAASVVVRLLDAAPGLTVMATSRIPLHLSGEQDYHVSPLALPERGRSDLETLSTCEAVMLFVERARAVLPSFGLTEENASPVAELIARLDGLPLAIELAASRLNLLDPRSMLARLDRRLPLLTGGARDVPARQRTLRGAIEWSHDLLSAEERRLFARLSVFAGGWTLEAAEAVCALGLNIDVLEGLGTLVEGSLVRRREIPDDGMWFRMMETIREYAAEWLADSGEEDELRRRHAENILELAEGAEPHLTGEGQGRWFARLEREHDNIRAALEWAVGAGEAEPGLRTVAAVWRFWQQRAHLAEGRARVEELLALPGAQTRDAVRTRALGALGSLAYWQGDYEPMRVAYTEAAAIAREVGDRRLLSYALFNLSFVPLVQQDLDAHEELLRQTLELAADTDPALTAQGLVSRGFLEIMRGNPAGAIEPTERALALQRQMGSLTFVAQNLIGLAGAKLLTGDAAGAWAHVRDAFAIVIEVGSPMMMATMMLPLAVMAKEEGRHRRVATLLGASARLREEVGGGPPQFVVLPFFGDPEADARQALGDEEYEEARAEGYAMSFDEAVAFALEESDRL